MIRERYGAEFMCLQNAIISITVTKNSKHQLYVYQFHKPHSKTSTLKDIYSL